MENQKGRKSYERKEAKVMAVKAVGKEEPHFPPQRDGLPITHGEDRAS